MNYPDGKKINVGDLILWNEGSDKGIVAVILEHSDDFKSFGIAIPGDESGEQLRNYGPSEKGILICTDLKKKDLTADVFCPEEDFYDEGVALIK
jgi:hypothetical protein